MNALRLSRSSFAPAARAPIALFGLAALLASGCSHGGGSSGAPAAARAIGPARSTNIALTSDGRRLLVANRDAGTLSVIQVRDATGADREEPLAEVGVGQEPRAVAVSVDDDFAFVANTASGTISVVALSGAHPYSVVETIPVGSEPRALALTPNGTRLFVAEHTARSVSEIDAHTLAVLGTRQIEGNPSALAITNDGDDDDLDETVYATQFFAELVPGGPGEGFDQGKQGALWALPVAGGAPAKITLAPFADVGFTADRALFCRQFNVAAHSDIFCPDVGATSAAADVIAKDPQGAYPNQLASLVLRNGRAYLPSIGPSPEPPVKFNVNVQALVNVVDVATNAELPDLHVNLNAQVKLETAPAAGVVSMARLFGNDLVAIDATPDGQRFLIVSRGGNFVFEAGLDAGGKLDLHAPETVRYQTGNIPTGIVISPDGKRAYVNNEVNLSVTVIDLDARLVLRQDLSSSTPPVPGSFAHAVALGKLVFHTALGVPEGGLFGTPLRKIEPLTARGKASLDAWSACASCHPDGHSDGVTWIFGTGPRQTIPLDAFFSKTSPADQRISNWSGVMGSITDFNNNSRGVQGGVGFAGDPPATSIFQHGATEGVSDALDAMTVWVQTVRAPILPPAENPFSVTNGETLFATSCSSCHAGAKWTKSQVVYDNNPTFDHDPAAGGVVLDPGLVNAGPQIVSFTQGTQTLRFLESVGTFVAADPLELRGQGATSGAPALGGVGFNVPSLLGVAYHAPYLHNGAAQTLAEVFTRHALGAGTIETAFTTQELTDLEAFLRTIDGATRTLRSATDDFLGH